jgi:hypothetical protein
MAAAPYALPPLLQIDQRGYRAASLIGEVLQPRAVFIASAGRLIVPCSHSEPSREVFNICAASACDDGSPPEELSSLPRSSARSALQKGSGKGNVDGGNVVLLRYICIEGVPVTR